MKKTFSVLGIIAIVAIIGFSMAACDDDGDSFDSRLVGKWYSSQESANAEDDGDLVYDIRANGHVYVNNVDSGARITTSGNNFTITLDGETILSGTYSITGTVLTMTVLGETGDLYKKA